VIRGWKLCDSSNVHSYHFSKWDSDVAHWCKIETIVESCL